MPLQLGNMSSDDAFTVSFEAMLESLSSINSSSGVCGPKDYRIRQREEEEQRGLELALGKAARAECLSLSLIHISEPTRPY